MEEISWHKIALTIAEIPFQENQLAIVEVAGKKITIAQFQDKFFACAHKCPHASGIMANGTINPLGQIVCPLHRYKFSLSNGRNTSGEGYFLKTYPVAIREDGVYIGLKSNGFWSLS